MRLRGGPLSVGAVLAAGLCVHWPCPYRPVGSESLRRTHACTEDGQCIKSSAADGAQASGHVGVGLSLSAAARHARDFGSESEMEVVKCSAYEVKWDTPIGCERLADAPCTAEGNVDFTLMTEDDFLDGRWCKDRVGPSVERASSWATWGTRPSPRRTWRRASSRTSRPSGALT